MREREFGLGRPVEGDEDMAVARGTAASSHQLRSPCHGRCHPRTLRRARRRLRRQPPAGTDRLAERGARQGAARPGDRRARVRCRGAKFVDLAWFDPWIKRARIAHAPDDSLEYVPPWYGERILALGRERGAAITLSGPVAPGLLDDLDPVRSGRDRLPAIRESGEVVSRRELNWTILPGPTPAWAELVHPDLEPDAALAKLEEQLLHVLRLDEDDPVARLDGARRHARRRRRAGSPSAASTRCTTPAPAPT